MEAFFEKYQVAADKIAVGVSGGADSLALALRLNDWAKKNGKKVVALSVDHGLRPESRSEVEYVAELMAKFGIEHHILTWLGEKPQKGIEEAARRARYDLVLGWCRENGVSCYATGHHMRDQAETFLLRLIRGSGVYGLSGMLPVSSMQGVTIIRPQLDDNPEDLRAYLTKRAVCWVEDPSNRCDDFLRVKIRKFLPTLEQVLGLDGKRLASTCATLANTRNFIESEIGDIMFRYVQNYDDVGMKILCSQFKSLHKELQFRLLSAMIKIVGEQAYAPESEEISRVCQTLNSENYQGRTLGGCEIFVAQQSIWVVKEAKNPTVLSKSAWDEFVLYHRQYRRLELPYKLRVAIVEKCMNQNRS